jgi:hypothetical protein
MLNIVTCTPTSRQRPKYARATIEKGLVRSCFYVVRAMPNSRQRVAKHIPAAKNISIVRQRRVKHSFATIEEAMFSTGPPRNHISNLVANQKSVSGIPPA